MMVWINPLVLSVIGICLTSMLVPVWTQKNLEEVDPDKPCDGRTISMPLYGKCLVPIMSAYTWKRAQQECKLKRGTLYETPWDLQYSNRELLNCMTSIPDLTDFWINSITILNPQFSWLNNTALNKILYCPTAAPPQSLGIKTLYSTTLSVDYCVLSCNEMAASYAVIHNDETTSMCYCVHNLDERFQVACDRDTMTYTNTTNYFIASTTDKPLIRVTQGESKAHGDILCAVVDVDTFKRGEMASQPCIERRPFICNLKNSVKCPKTTCDGSNCLFNWKDKCLRRVDQALNWYEARGYCNKTNGDLWQLNGIYDMEDINNNLLSQSMYWIGASNFQMEIDANSASLEIYKSNLQRVRCGHLVYVDKIKRWEWSSTACDQAKGFLCQFEKKLFKKEDEDRSAVCMGTIQATSKPIILPPTIWKTHTRDDDDSSFPIAALISALVALMVLLMCLAASCAYWSRRRRYYAKDDQVAFVPYVQESPDPVFVANGYEMENMSNRGRIRSGSSLSESGSHQFGPGKHWHGVSQTMTSESYTNNGGMFPSKSLDRLVTKDKRGMDANASYDERGIASSYNTLPIKPRDYMILEGQMNIQDESTLRASLRYKPEVTLVTDHADMNFTVNHATPYGNTRSNMTSLEQTLEEMHIPVAEGTTTVTVPERVVEAKTVTSMTNY